MTNTTLAAFKGRNSPTGVTNVNNGLDIFYDFTEGVNPLSTNTGATGFVGLGSSYPFSQGLYYPGSCIGNVTALGDSATIYSSEAFLLSSGVTTLQGRFIFDLDGERRINVAGKKMLFTFGLYSNSITGLIYLGFDPAVSNNWIAHFENGTTTDQTVTSIAVDDTEVYLKIISTPSVTYFYINNVLVHTSTYAIDSAFEPSVFFKMEAIKLDNATQIGYVCDAVRFTQTLVPNREF